MKENWESFFFKGFSSEFVKVCFVYLKKFYLFYIFKGWWPYTKVYKVPRVGKLLSLIENLIRCCHLHWHLWYLSYITAFSGPKSLCPGNKGRWRAKVCSWILTPQLFHRREKRLGSSSLFYCVLCLSQQLNLIIWWWVMMMIN